ncbi:MAG: FtsX-like permease family protein [Bacteroidaceae bacterium]|nr:FtsX-like permease family protein [Bacteroidaceae bacterium]
MGLIVSLTGAIIIARYVHQELTVDHYIPHLDRTFMLTNVQDEGTSHTEAVNHNHTENWEDPMADPAVECFTRFTCIYNGMGITCDGHFYQAKAIAVDSMFLEMLPRDVLAGTTEMKAPTDAVIAREFAERLWPGEHPIGKTLEHDGLTLNIVGMVDKASVKCNFDYDLLVHEDLKMFGYTGWSLIRLKEGEDWQEYNKRRTPFVESYEGMDYTYLWNFQLFPLADAYFDCPVKDYGVAGQFLLAGNRQSVSYLVAGAVMLLFVGLFNFFNIFVVVQSQRRRSMGVRRVFGASIGTLFGQTYVENVIVAAIAVALSWCVIALVSPAMSRFYSLSQIASPQFDVMLSLAIILLFPLAISTYAVAGMYSTRREEDIRNLNVGGSHQWGRHVSLWLQYVITFFLIVVSAYSICQLRYLLNADMGYKTENIVWFDLLPESRNPTIGAMTSEAFDKLMKKQEEMAAKADEAMRRIKESPLFVQACYHHDESPSLTSGRSTVEEYGQKAKVAGGNGTFKPIAGISLNMDDIEMYGLKLLEGEKPQPDRDEYTNYRIYMSKSAMEMLGAHYGNGDMIQFEDRLWHGYDQEGNYTNGNPPFTIVGVYDDIKLTHLGMKDIPFYIQIGSQVRFNVYTYFLAEYKPGMRKEALAFLQGIFDELNDNGGDMPYKLIEDDIAKVYEDDSRTTLIYTTFALLSILISCLGLFGISLYDIQHRRREIALRRVHGAMLADVLRLMMKRYMIALIIATAVGTPLAIYALHFYIEGYAHHVALTPGYFIAAFLTMLLLTFVTIYWQVRKAMKEEPAEILKE